MLNDPAQEKLFFKIAKNYLINNLDRIICITMHFKCDFISLIFICTCFNSLNKEILMKKVLNDPAEALFTKKFSAKFDANLCELYCLQISLTKLIDKSALNRS